jgi:hypothetical protein
MASHGHRPHPPRSGAPARLAVLAPKLDIHYELAAAKVLIIDDDPPCETR